MGNLTYRFAFFYSDMLELKQARDIRSLDYLKIFLPYFLSLEEWILPTAGNNKTQIVLSL